MKKIAALGTALLIGGGLVAGAAPAQAQPLACADLLDPACAVVNRQIAHVEEELGYALDEAFVWYDWADRTIRCVVFDQCP